ncbi:MAG: aminotransferase class V-fold PLP-dependent enzyme, partial [Vicinamibacteria bacterium]
MRRAPSLSIEAVRRDFPLLEREVQGKPVVYLDSAATSLKPRPVIRAVTEFYEKHTANVNRGVHFLSLKASQLFEASREEVASVLNASPREIVFTRNATEAIHLVARSLPPEETVLYTLLEHHSNFLPWSRRGAAAVKLLSDGRLDREDLERKLESQRPALLAIAHVSNAFGVVHPLAEIIEMAHARGARVLVDACQSAPHRPLDVQALDCDYLCFSGHKMCGPSGVGVLYGKLPLLEALPPAVFGGDMVREVHQDDFVLQDVPHRLE